MKKRNRVDSRLVDRYKLLTEINLDVSLRGAPREIATAAMLFYDIGTGTIRVAYEKLAKIASRHPSTAIRAMAKLEVSGYIEILEVGGFRGGRKWSNTYRPRLEALDEEPTQRLQAGARASGITKSLRLRLRNAAKEYLELRAQIAIARRAAPIVRGRYVNPEAVASYRESSSTR